MKPQQNNSVCDMPREMQTGNTPSGFLIKLLPQPFEILHQLLVRLHFVVVLALADTTISNVYQERSSPAVAASPASADLAVPLSSKHK